MKRRAVGRTQILSLQHFLGLQLDLIDETCFNGLIHCLNMEDPFHRYNTKYTFLTYMKKISDNENLTKNSIPYALNQEVRDRVPPKHSATELRAPTIVDYRCTGYHYITTVSGFCALLAWLE